MPVANTTGEQVIEVAVAGPDEANRLFITGTANVSGTSRTETWTFLVGLGFYAWPTLPRNRYSFSIFSIGEHTNSTGHLSITDQFRRG